MSARACVYADLKTSNFTILAQLKHTQTKTNQIKTKRKNIAIDRMHNTQKNRIFFTWFFCNTMWMTWVCIYRRVECVCVIFLFVFLFLSFSSTACTASTEFHILIAFVVDKKCIPIFFLKQLHKKNYTKIWSSSLYFFLYWLSLALRRVLLVPTTISRRNSHLMFWTATGERCVCCMCQECTRIHRTSQHDTPKAYKRIETKRNETKRHTNEQAKVVSVLCVCAR